ncbi:Nramp family divalent metal transporter [Aliidiomarina sp. Khilg15.8]
MSSLRNKVPEPPRSTEKIKWYGPGLLWMLSAVGTGSILFTPRVASVYRYELLWLLVLIVFFMWVMIREMARFSIVSGRTILDGMNDLRGPKGWAVWVIFVPQLLAAAVGIAGLAGVVGSALASFIPGDATLHAVLLLVVSTGFTVSGRYLKIEMVSRYMALTLMLLAIFSAYLVAPDLSTLSKGLMVKWPDDPDLYIILPWVGTILAGSMGIVWFGYWTASRGYGGGLTGRERDEEVSESVRSEQRKTESYHNKEQVVWRIKEWLKIMSGTAVLGVFGGLIVIVSFLILGSELLAPEGILPEGTDVALDLSRMFSGVWGEEGRLLLLLAIIIAIGGSILANQDGWGRSFADMTLILTRGKRQAIKRGWFIEFFRWFEKRTGRKLFTRIALKRIFILLITFVAPVTIVLIFKNPVAVMSASGIIAAVHTPFIVFTALLVNRTMLPKGLRPGILSTVLMALSGLFYSAFACLYLFNLLGEG